MLCSFCYLKVWYYLLQCCFCLDIKNSTLQFQLLSFQYASFICQRSTILMFNRTQFYNFLWLNAQVMRFEVSHNLRNQIGKGKLISSEVATGGVLQGKVFLEILWNSQENTCYSCRILLLLGSTWKKNYIKTWYIPLKRLESQDLENQQDQFREVGQNILQTRI